MNTIDLSPRRGIRAAICRVWERAKVSLELRYIESDIAFERAHLDALPIKVRALERHAEYLRVRQAVLRGST